MCPPPFLKVLKTGTYSKTFKELYHFYPPYFNTVLQNLRVFSLAKSAAPAALAGTWMNKDGIGLKFTKDRTVKLSGLGLMILGVALLLAALMVYNKPFESGSKGL